MGVALVDVQVLVLAPVPVAVVAALVGLLLLLRSVAAHFLLQVPGPARGLEQARELEAGGSIGEEAAALEV